jgi:hypothetical protein
MLRAVLRKALRFDVLSCGCLLESKLKEIDNHLRCIAFIGYIGSNVKRKSQIGAKLADEQAGTGDGG